MADAGKCATLYNATTNLAYSINQLARAPRPPFNSGDDIALSNRSTNVANAARAFRNRDPEVVADDAVDRASRSVKTAQVMIDTIDLRLDNGYSSTQVFAAIDGAAADVTAS